jgi:hypothetical protein
MLRKVMLLAAMLAMALVAAAPALAVSPHFVSADATLNPNGRLTVAFKEAGLGTNQLINYELSADATATYVCVNKGGSNPSASNKTTRSGPVSASGTFPSGKNGNVTASLTVSPPAANITCPKGQTLQTASVSYTNVSLTDTTNNIAASIEGTTDGTISSGCLLPNVRGACD